MTTTIKNLKESRLTNTTILKMVIDKNAVRYLMSAKRARNVYEQYKKNANYSCCDCVPSQHEYKFLSIYIDRKYHQVILLDHIKDFKNALINATHKIQIVSN